MQTHGEGEITHVTAPPKGARVSRRDRRRSESTDKDVNVPEAGSQRRAVDRVDCKEGSIAGPGRLQVAACLTTAVLGRVLSSSTKRPGESLDGLDRTVFEGPPGLATRQQDRSQRPPVCIGRRARRSRSASSPCTWPANRAGRGTWIGRHGISPTGAFARRRV